MRFSITENSDDWGVLMERLTKENIFIKTFGGFDIYINGEMVHFTSSKAKELLAYVVEKRGSSVSVAQLAFILYENTEEKKAKSNVRVIYYRLHELLVKYGLEDIIIRGRGCLAVNTDCFSCDLYEFIEGNPEYVNGFGGNYMPEYRWGERMMPYLNTLFLKHSSVAMLIAPKDAEAIGWKK